MKLIYVVIDGMGDLPSTELEGKTPLAAADTPFMDSLAKKGKTGRMYTISRGIAPESDAAVVSILGYDPLKYDVSRGVIEAVGAAIPFKDGDLALRCNFITLGADQNILDRRAGRNVTTEEATQLSKDINAKVKLQSHPANFVFKNTIGYRGVLVIRGEKSKLSGRITNTDPAYKRVGGLGVVDADAKMILQRCEPMDETEEAKMSADLVNEFTEKSHRILDQSWVNAKRRSENKLPANGITARDAGHLIPKLFGINEKYGVRFCCLADMNTEIGVARLAGMPTIDLPSPSGNLAEDCELRARKLLDALNAYDCFYIHIKGPDEPGHDGNCQLKTDMIATIDEHFFGNLLPKIRLNENLLCVTADHSTPCPLKSHSDDPVPLLIAGGNTQSDGSPNFSEETCKKGSLGTLEHGSELMPMLMKLLKPN